MFRRGDQDTDSSDSEPEAEPVAAASLSEKGEDEQASEDEGGLFGNMLELPAGESREAADSNESSRVVTAREFPLPKHLPSAFALPKKLLSDLIVSRKAMAPSRSAADSEPKLVVTTLEYKEISRGSRLARCRLDIVFTPENRSINKGNKHVSAVRRNVQDLGSSAVGTPLSNSGLTTPSCADASSEQLSTLGAAVEGIDLSKSQNEATAMTVTPDSSNLATPSLPPPPTFLDDFTYMIQMESVGCPTTTEAENYVALIALHELTTSTHHSMMTTTKSALLGLSSMTSPSSIALRMEYPPINARHLPVPYRDMWDELEVIRKLQEDEDSRGLWKGLDGVSQTQISASSTKTAENLEVSRQQVRIINCALRLCPVLRFDRIPCKTRYLSPRTRAKRDASPDKRQRRWSSTNTYRMNGKNGITLPHIRRCWQVETAFRLERGPNVIPSMTGTKTDVAYCRLPGGNREDARGESSRGTKRRDRMVSDALCSGYPEGNSRTVCRL